MMKKLLKLIAFILLVFLFKETLVQSNDTILPKAGITPVNKLYTIDRLIETISVKTTIDPAKKAEKLSNYADERIAELNTLNEEDTKVYSEQLYKDYIDLLDQSNFYYKKALSSEEDETVLNQLAHQIDLVSDKQNLINQNITAQISDDLKSQANNEIDEAKVILFTKITHIDETKSLYDEGFTYSQILKLQAISELTNLSIETILNIDGAVTTLDNQKKELNMTVILRYAMLGEEELNDQLQEYTNDLEIEFKEKFDSISHDLFEKLSW